MRVGAPAKINLGLRIVGRRPDGYHEIDTVFQRIGWADELNFAPGNSLRFACSDSRLAEDPESNLVVRAVRAVEEAVGIDLPLAIHLEKRLPYGAGLGGGSSDCAAALLACRDAVERIHGISLGEPQLHEIGARLGSDVPFFLAEGAQRGSGTGTVLERVRRSDGSPWRLSLPVVVVAPAVHISSATAYRGVQPREYDADEERPYNIVVTDDLDRYRRSLVNDFEPSVFAAFPQVERIKLTLLEQGAGYASLSGSGSAVYGIFETTEAASSAVEDQRGMIPGDWKVWMGMPE